MSLITVTKSIGGGAMSVSQKVADHLKMELYDDERLQREALNMGYSSEQKIGKLRLAPEGLTGYNVLKNYIEAHTEAFEER
jgi:hypothetical protein